MSRSNAFAQAQKGKSHSVMAGMEASIGDFSDTHAWGARFNYAWSHHRFGAAQTPLKLLGFTANVGANYFFGKKDVYNVKYDGYSFCHIYGGLISNPSEHLYISLTAGPFMGFYKSDRPAGVGVNCSAGFYLGQLRHFSIIPGIDLKKEQYVTGIWSGSLCAAFSF